MEAATERHFFHHGAREATVTKSSARALEKEQENCHWCQIRSFPTHKQYPITIVNEVDDAVIPSTFRFLQQSKLGAGVQAAEDSFRTGCECDDVEECQYSGCLCLQEQEDASDDEGHRRNKVYMYHMHGVKAGLLRSKFLQSKRPVYECHEGCACAEKCPNRVVERGRKRRRNASSIAERKDVYLFALDKFTDKDSPDVRLRGPPLEVDGEFMSGPTRFINHSCEPNLRIFARVGDHADKHIHDIAMFALRDIPRGEQLTFDYVDGVSEEEDDAKDKRKQGDMVQCLCGAKNCRKFLW
ncbi:histone-lysine N-methyltransferase [Colletotrichum higginsianum]|nr:histone-lysine N-methyltransferase [Colletotrichum higginsianum]